MSNIVNIERDFESAGDQSIPLHPGEYIEATLLVRMSQTDLAKSLGVSRQIVNMIVNKKRPLTAGMAMKLASITDKDLTFWLTLQEAWDNWSQTTHGIEARKESERERVSNRWEIAGSRFLNGGDIERALECGLLGITDFERRNLQAASYDFRLGQFATLETGGDDEFTHQSRDTLEIDDEFVIPPQSVIQAETFESIRTPQKIVGRLGAPTSIIQYGIFYSVGLQIDPEFDGRMQFLMENRSSVAVQISAEQAILSCEFVYLASASMETFEKPRAGTIDGPFGKGVN